MRFQSCIRIAAFSFLGMTAHTWAQSDYMPPMSGWPANIQTAWQVQGDYYGAQVQDTSKHIGAWLVANSATNFGLVILPGGLLSLPGQPYGGWDQVTRYQNGTTGPVAGTLTGTTYHVTTTTGGFVSDSITGTGEARTMYVHNTNGTTYVLHRVKRHSPTMGLKMSQVKGIVPGADSAISLFDSSTGAADLSKWVRQADNPALKYNLLTYGVNSAASYGRAYWHIEFLSCFNPTATGQGRANSGIYQQGRYETQVLDSYGLAGAINEYGAIYEIKAPTVNAEGPPQVAYQTYDVYFTPRSSGAAGTTAGAAYFTVYANGVKVQDSTLATDITTAAPNTFGTSNGPLNLQDHGNQVVFTNIWVIPNATVHTLDYNAILTAAGVGGSTAINKNYIIRPFSRKTGLNIPGFNGIYDLTGRQIRRNGAVLSIEPTVLLNPQGH